MKKNQLKILFIGNSHTYFNDMPIRVKRRFDEEGYNCSVTMLAHPGWFLAQHVEDPEAKFNIIYGEMSWEMAIFAIHFVSIFNYGANKSCQ